MFDGLGLGKLVIGFLFEELWFARDDEESRLARAVFVKDTNEVRTNGGVGGDLDVGSAVVGFGFEGDSRGIGPELHGPGIELADGGDRVSGADLNGDGIEVVQRGGSGVEGSCDASEREQRGAVVK